MHARPMAASRNPLQPWHSNTPDRQLPAPSNSCSPGATINMTFRCPPPWVNHSPTLQGQRHYPGTSLPRPSAYLALLPRPITISRCSLQPPAPSCHLRRLARPPVISRSSLVSTLVGRPALFISFPSRCPYLYIYIIIYHCISYSFFSFQI